MTDQPPDSNNPAEGKSTVLQLYGLFGAGLVVSVIPSYSAALACLVLFLGLMIAAGVVKNRSANGSLRHNHATYIGRTIWIACAISLPSMALATLYMLRYIDNAALMPCVDQVINMMGSVQTSGSSTSVSMDMPDITAMSDALQSCLNNYIGSNLRVFIISGTLAAGPVLIYTLYRYIHGLMRALRGYRIANPKRWF